MKIAVLQAEDKLLASKLLELLYRRHPFSLWPALTVSGLLAAALWPLVRQPVLLAWLLSLWLVMAVRNVYARRYLKLGHGAVIDHRKWQSGLVAGAALTGACWGFSVLSIPASPLDPASMMLLMVIAGVAAFCGISMAAVPLAAAAFLLSALLPVAFWLFSFGERITFFMGAIALTYLGAMLLFSRQTHRTLHSMLAVTEHNKELAAALAQVKALERESALFRRIVDDTRDPAIFVSNFRNPGRFDYLNEAVCRHFGASREEIMAWHVSDWDPHYDTDKIEGLNEALRQTGSLQFETEHRLPSGARIPVEVTLNAVEFGGEPFVVGYFHSLVKHKAEEARMRQLELAAAQQASDQRMLRYFESAPGYFYTLLHRPDGSYAIPFASPGIRELCGLEPEAVVQDAAAFVAMSHPDDVEMTSQKTEESERKLTPYNIEYRILHPHKGERWIEVHALPQRTADGGTRWDGFMHDITMRKALEQHLKLKEFVLDQAHEAVYLMDRENMRFVYVNEEACRSLGYGREELLGLGLSDIDPEITPEAGRALWEKVIANGAHTFETRHRRRDGSSFPVEIQGSLFEYEGQSLSLSLVRNITERKLMEDALARREREYRTLLENTPDVVVRYDRECRRIYVNPAWARVNGIAVQDVLGKSPQELSSRVRPIAADFERMLRGVMASGQANETDLTWRDDTGEEVCFALSAIPEYDDNGEVTSVLTMARDISERKQMEAALIKREQEARTLIENSPDNIARYDRDGRCTYVNPAFAALVEGGAPALLGKSPIECPGGPFASLFESQIGEVFACGEDAEFELNGTDSDGNETCSHIRLAAERDASGAVVSVLSVGRDITELNAHRNQIHQMAFYDMLTSLPNRALFNDRLQQMLADVSWHGQLAGVMLLDLDRFKAVNDTLGHAAGDELLREAAARLNHCVRSYDTVARLGGDEFAILLPEMRSSDDMGLVANKILAAFSAPFVLENKEMFVSCSIGIAVYPSDGEDAADLLKQADSAMYFAKRSGRNTFRFYSRDLTASANEKLMLETDLRHSFKRGELELYYQPKVRLADGSLTGSEALLRWQHPQRGMVPPDKFIPIAEDSGLIVEIGAWVLRNACRTASGWNGPGKPVHKVAINLSARQFQSDNLVNTVRDALAEAGCRPEWIELEITESLLLEEGGEVLEALELFREMGITIAIDDFGTGYSSLSYLARFPIDTLKIDRSFISRVAEDGHHAELVKAIISIANSLNQKVVAEGVETAAQATALQAYGCHVAQGYLFSRPIPKPEFELLPLSFGQDAVGGWRLNPNPSFRRS